MRLEAIIESLERQLALSQSNQKNCLTKEQMLATNQTLMAKVQKIEDRLSTELKNIVSEMQKMKSQEVSTTPKPKELEKPVETKMTFPSSCKGKQTELLEIQVSGSNPFQVSCDSTLAGSGWLVIQRRQDGSENFNRNMQTYRTGFGNLNNEFFIGLDKLYMLTSSKQHELYIYLKNFRNEVRYALYSSFRIGGVEENFKLKALGEYSGNAGNAMIYYLNMEFSTPDEDHDIDPARNCANWYRSGWWYKTCHHR